MNKKMKQAIKEFANTDEFRNGVVSSTIAGYGGSGYSVEFFNDGTHRVLWQNNIGNGYITDGIIIPLPQLDTDWDDEETIDPNDKDDLREAFTWQKEDLQNEFLESAFWSWDE